MHVKNVFENAVVIKFEHSHQSHYQANLECGWEGPGKDAGYRSPKALQA